MTGSTYDAHCKPLFSDKNSDCDKLIYLSMFNYDEEKLEQF